MDFKKNKWLILGGVAIVGYLWWKSKNKPSATKMVENAEQDVEQAVNEVVKDVENA
jgi:hypothetical protein